MAHSSSLSYPITELPLQRHLAVTFYQEGNKLISQKKGFLLHFDIRVLR